MDIERVRALAELMAEQGLTSLEIWEGKNRIILSKNTADSSAPAASASVPAAPASESKAVPASTDTDEENTLKSPLVGCVYFQSRPNAKPFVAVGDSVKKGQVLCVIEAMKVMNEFVSPRDGKITEIYPKNGQLVEFGQPLFRLQ